MEKGYFSAAWGDVTKSPGWFSKMLRMGLLCFIPIFGILVVYGYLYGWARDIAWNVHRPMPERIFGNEDGNLYKRGFFVLVIGFVFSLIPGAFNIVTSMITGFSFIGAATSSSAPLGMGSVLMGLVFSFAGLVLTFAVVFFYWVGAMRCALYGTLSSGFQFGKIWAMMRYDFNGLLRIFGMSLICGAVIGIVAFIAIGLFVLLSIIIGVAFIQNEAQAVVFVLVILLLCLVICVVSAFLSVLVAALISRALGYWTRQFQVNLWGGQEDPMPFELEQARQSQQNYNAYNAQQPYQQPYQPPYQQPYQQPGNPYQQPGGFYQQPGQPYQANSQAQENPQVQPQSQPQINPQTQQPAQPQANPQAAAQAAPVAQQSAQPQRDTPESQSRQAISGDQPQQSAQPQEAVQPESPVQAESASAEPRVQAESTDAEPPIIDVEPISVSGVAEVKQKEDSETTTDKRDSE